MLQLRLICVSCCALYQAQRSSDAAVIAGAGEAAMRIAVAHQIRLDAASPADVIPIWSQVLLHCHLQPAAFIVHRKVELHHALSKRLRADHSCPASHSPTAGESLTVSCRCERSVLILRDASTMQSSTGAACESACSSMLMSAGPRSGVQGGCGHLWLALRAPEKTSAALAVPPLTRMTTGLDVSCDGCAENTCDTTGRGQWINTFEHRAQGQENLKEARYLEWLDTVQCPRNYSVNLPVFQCSTRWKSPISCS